MEKSYTTLLKVTLLHGCFSPFLICANGTKTCNASYIDSSLTLLVLTFDTMFSNRLINHLLNKKIKI